MVAKQIVPAVFGYDVQVISADELLQMRHFRAVSHKIPTRLSIPQRGEPLVIDKHVGSAGRV